MKIKEIKQQENRSDIFIVTFTPNWLEKLFGKKEKQKEFKDTGREFTFGGGTLYVDRSGVKLNNFSKIGDAIDNFRRSW